MKVSIFARTNPFGDALCRVCRRASRMGQWVASRDTCPHCGAPGSERLAWSLMRLRYPSLPLSPEIGAIYDRDIVG